MELNQEGSMERRRIGGLIWEGLVVVASILIAFALDAWWDSNNDAAALRLELMGVAQELSDNRAALAERVEGHRLQISSITELLVLQAGSAGSGSVEVSDSILFRAAVTSPTTDPSAGALAAMIASGRISLVRDVELRRFLAAFQTRVEDVREDELGARAIAHDRVFQILGSDPAAEAAASLPLGLGATDRFPLSRSRVSLDPETWRALRSNLALRRWWLSVAVAEAEDFLQEMDRALESLASEISGP